MFVLTRFTHQVSFAVYPRDSARVVVSGWASVSDNKGPEGVWLTEDSGKSWREITANLPNADTPWLKVDSTEGQQSD